MARMTEEEVFALDEKWTKTDPKLGPNGSGFLARRKTAHMITIDALSADYLFSKAFSRTMSPMTCNGILPVASNIVIK